MSRRLRAEKEYAEQLKQEADEEDDKLKRQMEKITAPVVWLRLKQGVKIVDLRENMYMEVLEMIQEYYLPNEVLSRNSELEYDEKSLKSFLDHTMYTIKDDCSIVALDEDNDNELMGALILRVEQKANFGRVFSRTAFSNGDARKKCLQITTALNRKVDIFEIYNCETFLRYFLLCVKDHYRKTSCGFHLMRMGLEVARSFNIQVSSGIFTSFSLQKTAKKIGFEVNQEISYTNWRDKTHELIFSDPGAGNYTCALMVAITPKETFSSPDVIKYLKPSDMQKIEPPRTRVQKRAALNRRNSITPT